MEINLRFGMHRDIPIIHLEHNCIDGLVIPAHILAYQLPSTSVFVASMPGMPYVIDPMTFMLQSPRRLHLGTDGQLRPSVQKLFAEFHPGLPDLVLALKDEEALPPQRIPEPEQLCENLLQFQISKVQSGCGESRAGQYLSRYSVTNPTQPRAIVAPYFFFNSEHDPWYDLSLRCARHTLNLTDGGEILSAAVVFCSARSLSSAAIAALSADYSAFEEVILWVEDYDEREAASGVISRVRQTIRALSANARVHVLYGGYLMMLSVNDGLAGVSHGILYTQHKARELTPGSGGAPERYYIPAFHDFRSLSQTDLILHHFPELVCNCEVCSSVLGGNPDNIIQFNDDPDLLRRHFLNVRRAEADRLAGGGIAEELAALGEAYDSYNAAISMLPNPDAFVAPTRMKGLAYLEQWRLAFA